MTTLKGKKHLGIKVDSGVLVSSVEVSFFAQSTPEKWRRCMDALGCKLELEVTNAQSPYWETTFVALPNVLAKGDRYLHGEVHTFRRSPEKTHWILKLQPVPNPTPPDDFIEQSRQLGGYPDIIDRIVENWPAERQIDVQSKVSLILDQKIWRSPFAPRQRMALKPVSADEQTAHLSFESYSWDFEPPRALSKITDLGYVDKERKLFALSCAGQETVELSKEILSHVETTLWRLVRGFLKTQQPRRPKT